MRIDTFLNSTGAQVLRGVIGFNPAVIDLRAITVRCREGSGLESQLSKQGVQFRFGFLENAIHPLKHLLMLPARNITQIYLQLIGAKHDERQPVA